VSTVTPTHPATRRSHGSTGPLGIMPPRATGHGITTSTPGRQLAHHGGHTQPAEAKPHTPSSPKQRIHATPRTIATVAPPSTEVPTTVADGVSSLFTPWAANPILDPFTAAQIAHYETLGASLDQPPAFLIPIYKAAGRHYHIPWQILAAINAIETDYGRNVSTSSAGAVGFMQFEPATFMQYGVAADGRSTPNPYNARDAIFSAARYLAANGGRRHLRKAIFAYNHALWYVDAVLWRAQVISDRALTLKNHHSGYALPLDAGYMRTLGRTDDGVDIEDAPDGAAVYSITPGVVTAVAADPSGFGPNYPVVTVTGGPLKGQSIYYGHVAASLVHAGDKILAGEPIAVMGHTGDAAYLGHGHIEIGFSDGSGDPLNHGGATPSGDAMRHVLVALSALYRVTNS
jgi:murein DD-endopeptidase MepM/ murein hydrolase activator NlpD